MKVGIDISGLGQLIGQLERLGANAQEVIDQVVFDLAEDTRGLAVSGILGGPKSGVTYIRGNITHTASAPGQYPANDTGRLAGSVKAIINGSTAIVGTNVMYGPMLEFGTSRMAARPWLFPSFEAARVGVEKQLRALLEAKTK